MHIIWKPVGTYQFYDAFSKDFFNSIIRVQGRLFIYGTARLASSAKETGLINLMSIGGKTTEGEPLAEDAYYSLSLSDSDRPFYDLYALQTVETGNIHIESSNCYIKTINFEGMLRNSTEQTVTVVDSQLACQDNCSVSCNDKCWGPGEDKCQKMSTVCNGNCTNGCFGAAPSECCSVNCTGGCKGPAATDCYQYESCPQYSDVNGVCIPECSSDKYLLYDRFCVEECPVASRKNSLSPTYSSGTFLLNPQSDETMVAWIMVKYDRTFLFYYAIINIEQSEPKTFKDVSFMTDGTNWPLPSISIPDLRNKEWELCDHQGEISAEKYLLKCIFGDEERLVYKLGVTAKSSLKIGSIQVYGNMSPKVSFASRLVRSEFSAIIDGVIRTPGQTYNDQLKSVFYWIKTEDLIQLSHMIIYTRFGIDCSGVDNCYNLLNQTAVDITPYLEVSDKNITYSEWQTCTYLNDISHSRYVVTSCDQLVPFTRHPHVRGIIVRELEYKYEFILAEIEVYQYNRDEEQYFSLNRRCVERCLDGYELNAELNCIKIGEVEEKTCYFEASAFNETNYMSIETGCTHVAGDLTLDFSDFRNATEVGDILSVLQQALSSIKLISGSLIVKSSSQNLPLFTNLTMFRNLQYVLGVADRRAAKTKTHALVLDIPELNILELENLEEIKGPVYLHTPNLCLPSINNIFIVLKTSFTNNNITEYNCSTPDISCHEECDNDCVGPRSTQCLSCPPESPSSCKMCKNYQLDNNCVSTCGTMTVNRATNQCGDCHEECAASCNGTLDTNCEECKNFRYRDQCVSQCPPNSMEDNIDKICETLSLTAFPPTEEEVILLPIMLGLAGVVAVLGSILYGWRAYSQNKKFLAECDSDEIEGGEKGHGERECKSRHSKKKDERSTCDESRHVGKKEYDKKEHKKKGHDKEEYEENKYDEIKYDDIKYGESGDDKNRYDEIKYDENEYNKNGYYSYPNAYDALSYSHRPTYKTQSYRPSINMSGYKTPSIRNQSVTIKTPPIQSLSKNVMTNNKFSLPASQERSQTETDVKKKGLLKSIVNNRISAVMKEDTTSAAANPNDLSKLMEKLNTVENFKDGENPYGVTDETVKARSHKEPLYTHQEQSTPRNKKKSKVLSKKNKPVKKKSVKRYKK